MIPNSTFLKANRAAWQRFHRSPQNIEQLSFGVHDAFLDEALYLEANSAGVALHETLPPLTFRGKDGAGRVSTARTLVARELIAKHGEGAVKWTGIDGWNARLIRWDLTEEYRKLMRKHLGL
jgi:hypothetical protein